MRPATQVNPEFITMMEEYRKGDSAKGLIENSSQNVVVFAEKMYSALEGADFLVIATEWPEFRTPDFARIDGLLAEKVIFDGRNVFEMDTMRKHGYTYYSIGRKDIK